MPTRLARGAAVAILASALACGRDPATEGAPPEGPMPSETAAGESTPELLPSLQATTFGDSVRFVLQVTNTTERAIDLQFGSGQSFDFTVERDGAEVWRWSADRMFTQALRSRTLAPGETLTFSAGWTPPAGTSGDFTVRGVLTASGPRIEQTAHFRLP